MEAIQPTLKVLAEQTVTEQPTTEATKRAPEPLAADAADYWLNSDRFLECFLLRNNLRNEDGTLKIDDYEVRLVHPGDRYSRSTFEIRPVPKPKPVSIAVASKVAAAKK
jgi:hypothetical protein